MLILKTQTLPKQNVANKIGITQKSLHMLRLRSAYSSQKIKNIFRQIL